MAGVPAGRSPMEKDDRDKEVEEEREAAAPSPVLVSARVLPPARPFLSNPPWREDGRAHEFASGGEMRNSCELGS